MHKRNNNNVVYPKEDDKSDVIKKLRGANRHLQKENRRLKSELRTLEAAFVETQGFLKKQEWDFSIEEVIRAVKHNRRLQVAKNVEIECNRCGADMEQIAVPNMGTVCICTNCTHRYTIRTNCTNPHE